MAYFNRTNDMNTIEYATFRYDTVEVGKTGLYDSYTCSAVGCIEYAQSSFYLAKMSTKQMLNVQNNVLL